MKRMEPWNKYSPMTMTVGDIKAALAKYSDDLRVIATWEGCLRPIRKDGFKSRLITGDIPKYRALLINVNNRYGVKD